MPGFVKIWDDFPEVTEALDDAERGRLVIALVLFIRGGDWESAIKGNERYLFPSFRRAIERDRVTEEQKRAAGKKSGEARRADANTPEQNRTPANTPEQTRTEPNTTKQPAAQASKTPKKRLVTYNVEPTKEDRNQEPKERILSPPITPLTANPALQYTQRRYTADEINRTITTD